MIVKRLQKWNRKKARALDAAKRAFQPSRLKAMQLVRARI
jgi:hypothetical protein